MKSASFCEIAPPLVAAKPEPRTMPENRPSSEPFGSILEEATAGSATYKQPPSTDADSTDVLQEEEDGAVSKTKKKDEAASAVPLTCFCPLPTVESIQTASATGQTATATPATTEPAQATPQSPETASNSAKKADETSTGSASQSLTQTVSPKTTAAQAGKSSGAVELDPNLFRPVADEVTAGMGTLKKDSAKPPEPQRPQVANASHGTLVAQLENRVKNTEKSAEIAPTSEQKMPVREVFRRGASELGRVEPFHADKQPGIPMADFESGPLETIPVKSLEAARLVETIRTEVTNLRQRGDSTMTVTIRPDSGTQLSLDLSIARDGSVHAIARCERGDFQALHTQWPQLQQSLAAHGITIADLANSNQSQQQNQQNQRSASAFQNFEGGQNPKQRNQHDAPNFEDQFSASKSKFLPVKPQPQPAVAAPKTRRWQSWA
jgi:hypothetical protein